jgi:E3 ubiquitin-protein ligase SHPRH
LLAERTLLAAHETRDKSKRKTKTSAMAVDEPLEALLVESIIDDVELRPQDEALKKELAKKRKDLLQEADGRAIKSVMVELNGVAARITSDSDPEKVIVKDAAALLRQLMVSQGTLSEFIRLAKVDSWFREGC